MFSGFIHVAAGVRIAFPVKAEWRSVVCTDHILYLSIQWWTLRLLPFLATVTNVITWAFKSAFESLPPILWGCIRVPRRGIAGLCGNSMCDFLRTSYAVFHRGWITTFPPAMKAQGLWFLYILADIYCFLAFITTILSSVKGHGLILNIILFILLLTHIQYIEFKKKVNMLKIT